MKVSFKIMIAALVLASLFGCKHENTSPKINGRDVVDLGLSVRWATCNVGADKPEDGGLFFAWGEVEGKEEYKWSNYKHCGGDDSSINKYNGADDKKVLEPVDDAASALWGGTWRMPTMQEWEELKNQCAWEWDESKKGYTITSKTNGNSIFLPAAGYYNEWGLQSKDEIGSYWSSLVYEATTSLLLVFDKEFRISIGSTFRFHGRSVRAVAE